MDAKTEYAIKAHGMDMAYSKVIIGLSGGADSSLLLHYFAKRSKEVVCVHVNHMIRGAEADRDEEFCRALCEKYGVTLVVHKIDIPSLADKLGLGIEETARAERYRVFYEELDKRGFDAILVAHNADDNLESIVFNLARGAGINGLSGIKPVNEKVLRPLIYLSKDEIFSFCAENNIEYVTDSTNEDTDYTRNYIRHEIVPKLKKLNPDLKGAISRMAETLRSDEDYILSQAKVFMLQCNGKVAYTDKLLDLHKSVRARVYRLMSGVSLDYKSITACDELLINSECGSYINLKDGLVFKKEHDYVHFLDADRLARDSFSYSVRDGLYIKELDATMCLSDEADESALYSIALRVDGIKGDITVRSRREGDKITANKMTKKVKRILCDAHIPSHLRDKLPIICDDGGICAIADLCVCDRVKPIKNGKNMVINFYKSM